MSTATATRSQQAANQPGRSRSAQQKLARWRCRRALPAVVRQLALMLRAGLDLSTALDALARGANRPEVAELIRTIHDRVERGHAFAQALEDRPDVFPPMLIASVAAAEASGTLAPALERTANRLEEERRLRNSVLSMLAYPCALVLLSALVVVALVVFVLPRFREIFDNAGVPLPWTTRALLVVSDAIIAYPLLATLSIVLTATAVYAAAASGPGKRWLRYRLLRLPAVGPVVRFLELGHILQSLGAMLETGVPLLEALELARRSARVDEFRTLIKQMRDSALQGQGLAQPLRRSWLVPPEVAEMAATAERTGSLAWVLQFVGRQYQETAETQLKVLVRLIEPLLIITLGGIVAVIVASVMLPLFDLSRVAAAG